MAAHLGALAIVLLACSFVVGHGGYVFIDEAALLAQVEIVQDGTWSVPRPLADVDPEGRFAPMARSTIAGGRFAPFPNHPLHVLIATGADSVGGMFGIRLLSVLGALGAALAAGLLAAPKGRICAAAAMWVTGVASPLLFDANLVVAHALGAGVAGGLLVLSFRTGRRGERAISLEAAELGGVAVLAFIGPLLRSEMVLFGLALAVVATLGGLRRRSARPLAVGAAAALGAAGAYLLESWWVERLLGASGGLKVISSDSRGGVEGTLNAARTVLIGFGDAPAGYLALAVGLTAGAAWLLRWRAHDAGPAAVLTGGGVAAAIQAVDAAVVPGLLWAFPLLLVGVGTRRCWRMPRPSTLVAIVFGLLVLATQYAVGGGVEWGWRYFAVALPAVGAALAAPLAELARSARSPAARSALGGIVAVSVLIPVSGVLWQREQVRRSSRLSARTATVLQTTRADLIVAAEPSFGRYAWEQSIAGDVITVQGGAGELRRVLDALDERGLDRVLLVWHGEAPSLARLHDVRMGPVYSLLDGGYQARLLTSTST